MGGRERERERDRDRQRQRQRQTDRETDRHSEMVIDSEGNTEHVADPVIDGGNAE